MLQIHQPRGERERRRHTGLHHRPRRDPPQLVAGALDQQRAGARHLPPGRVHPVLRVLPEHVERAHHHRREPGQLETAPAELQARGIGEREGGAHPYRIDLQTDDRDIRTDGSRQPPAKLDRGDRRRAVPQIDHQGHGRRRQKSPASVRDEVVHPPQPVRVGRAPGDRADRFHLAYSSRCTLCWAACAIGRITSRSMLTCCGRVAANAITSAMSSATSGSFTPA